MVFEALESEGEWVTDRVRPGKLVLGRLGDIEAGVGQLIRTRPLESASIELSSGRTVRVPTPEETLRIKAFLVVGRNRTRDYADVAALAEEMGNENGPPRQYTRPYGVSELMTALLQRTRQRTEEHERTQIAEEIRLSVASCMGPGGARSEPLGWAGLLRRGFCRCR